MLKDKAAFITGGGGYLGSETARTLARAGAAVAVSDLNRELTEKVVREIQEAGGTAAAYPADVTDSKDIDRAIRSAFADFGGLDIMLHIAGGSARERAKPLVEQTDEVIQEIINVNLMGAIYASRTAAQLMIQQNRGGRIINFSSTVGLMGLACATEYAAAKSGVMGMTKALAKELGPYGITVNTVAPGIVMRPDANLGDDYALKTNVLGKQCVAADIADLVEFLVSDKARFITGQCYVIDGGRSLAMKGTD